MVIQDWLGENNEVGIDIWEKKYRQNKESFDDWIDRVSDGDEQVKSLLLQKKFLFGGRILSNRGLHKKGLKSTYSNCYVVSPPEDNIESIFECASKLARTFSYGGGVGIDISKLAPNGAAVHNAAKHTSGAVSFMDLFSHITGLIGQNGRRGALMISLDCTHPDLEEFINIKSDLERVTKANISIKITKDFMEAVKQDLPFTLSFTREETGETIEKTVQARELFYKIAKMNWDYGEPGFLFWDRIKEWNLLSETKEFEFAGTNPCAEEPLPAGGSCLLGSINLAEFVTDDNKFDFDDFKQTVDIAVRALNNVLDEGLPLHPLEEQRTSVHDWRQIGLGIFGLADMLIKCELRYGSVASISLCQKIAKCMIETAIETSNDLAEKIGCFRSCDKEAIVNTEFFKHLDNPILKERILKYGLRNSQLLTIAPTGTLSTMLGVSGGIEPIFANFYTRKTESLHGADHYYKVYTPIVQNYMSKYGLTDDKDLPGYFVTSSSIPYENRILMQSTWQMYIDASISSTINVPEDFTVENVEKLYKFAYEKGLKGVTLFRDNCKRVGVLTTERKEETKEEKQKLDFLTPNSRKTLGTLEGKTYCKKCACGTLYITINHDSDGNPIECFINTSKGGICQANTSAVARMISLNMRAGVAISEIVKQLQGITCSACIKVATKGEEISGISCSDIIGKAISDFYIKNNTGSIPSDSKVDTKLVCPDCRNNLEFSGGCVICTNCGWSKCS